MSAKPAAAAVNVIEVEHVLGETYHPAFQLLLLALAAATRQRGRPSEPRTA
ncbi:MULTISPECIES: hypothetical protein [unclassified Paraburkholderia]|uniref:hypothetical protein n=1 Tax=unclassified Paraburkholderia TaxID=2615204 RepID=UPI000E38963D|nr:MULTISPECIES: hypothetical protein [unclassified Paraburkholderia]REE20240.1 hypothetical protein B0G71_3366 [Paraburkholderia sp. BL27I4N3]RKR43037.1 hypothetical protein B0G82_0585 [Paraburkholderia sp. BL17N1]